ncbi:MAG: GIY-YIG nuclease family protein [Flavobacteriales bacterium]
MRQYWVYMMTNKWNTTLYTGVTNDLIIRVSQHKAAEDKMAFTAIYQLNRLAWFEEHNDINFAIVREKQIKRWKREWKNELIRAMNPTWRDLSDDWLLPNDGKAPEMPSECDPG